MVSNLPIRFQELLQLSNSGINTQFCTFNSLTIESEKWICIKEITDQQASNVIIVDLDNPSSPTKFSISADSALMNPKEKILALKAGTQLQIFHIEQKKKLKEFLSPEPIIFWKWLNINTLGFVTKTATYHWSIQGQGNPTKQFDVNTTLAESQIINYRADSALKWMVLIGIYPQEEGRIAGSMQLYSQERNQSQSIEGHAAAFANWTDPATGKVLSLFAFSYRNASQAKLFVLEVGKTEGSTFQKRAIDVYYPQDAAAAGDFPVSMQISENYGIIYMVTKLGYVHLFDLATATAIYMVRISAQPVFVSTFNARTEGIICVNRSGQVLSVSVDDANIVSHIMNSLKNVELAFNLASRANLPGAEELSKDLFSRYLQQGQIKEAAKIAATSPKGCLRTQQTLQRFQSYPLSSANQVSPLLTYFGALLDTGKLNKFESIELVVPVVQQNKSQLLEKWLNEDKLECSEELGDIAKKIDAKLALHIYAKADAKGKIVATLAELGHFQKIIDYCSQTGFKPDWTSMLHNLLASNPQAAASFANSLVNSPSGPLININSVIDVFGSRNMIKDLTSILLDYLKPDKPEDGPIQTKLLEINLLNAPAVADAIIGNDMFHHYDKKHIASLCEKKEVGLYQRALEHYTDISDIKRVMLNTHKINSDFLVEYFQRLDVEDTFICLNLLMANNNKDPQAAQNLNLNIVIKVAIKYSQALGIQPLIKLFETHKSYEGLFYYLGAILSFSQDPEVHFKYIQAAAKTRQFHEVERVCRESNYYDPEKTKNYLKEARLSEQLPLIIVCDRFNFITDLTQYLYQNNQLNYLEAYVQKINKNPANVPIIIGTLLDLDSNEDFIKTLISLAKSTCPIDQLADQLEKRNRLRILLPWLESRVAEGYTDAATHNAIAKIYVDINQDPEHFLLSNQYYESLAVGKYCQNQDPHLALIAFKRGLCDTEYLQVSNKNGLFKQQARYVVDRQDPTLWATVLSEENEFRKNLVEQVIQTVLPECTAKNTEEVLATVKAFMTAKLPKDLMRILEKLIIEGNEFKSNKSLQNLLLLTAIKADTTKVMDYINRLDNYEASEIANISIGAGLYEEAFVILKKFKQDVQALKVLIDYMTLDRAEEFAAKIKDPAVLTRLGKAQLDKGHISKAIASFIEANDPEYYVDVIEACNKNGLFEDLVQFLQMCRRKPLKEPTIDSELLYAFAKTDRLNEIEEFISTPTNAHIQNIGDRCYSEGLFQAARILYTTTNNYPRLASTYLKLVQFTNAYEAAKKANSTRTWKEVNLACLEAREFRLAQLCGLNIILHSEELSELISNYETRDYSAQLISLLEAGLSNERAHVSLFTELAILYCKYSPDVLFDHVKLYSSRLNVSKVIRACLKYEKWPELVFLYNHSEDYDSAANTIMQHPVQAWDNSSFKETLSHVVNTDVLSRAVQFYLHEHPLLINELLTVVSPRLDLTRIVDILREKDAIPLAKPFLQSVQRADVAAVNEALNTLYVEEGLFDLLRESITSYKDFDSIALARKLENHELVEFRRVAALLYQSNEKWADAIRLSKKDQLWSDAIKAAAASAKSAICEELIKFFAERQQPDCFASALFSCYDFVRPDVAMEIAWRFKLIDYAMPFLVQTMREFSTKMEDMSTRLQAVEQILKPNVDGFNDGLGSVPVPIAVPVVPNDPTSFVPFVPPIPPVSFNGAAIYPSQPAYQQTEFSNFQEF